MDGIDHIPQAPAPSDTPTPSAPAISDAIEKLLAHPELLSSIASTIGLGKASPTTAESTEPLADAKSASAPEEAVLPVAANPSSPTSDLGEAVAALAPLLSAFSGKGGGGPKGDDPRTCLLRALKPYVSRGRAEAIDTIIQLSRVSDVLKKFS